MAAKNFANDSSITMNSAFDNQIKKALSQQNETLPEGHLERFEKRLGPSKPKNRFRVFYMVAAAAAAAVVIFIWLLPIDQPGASGIAPIHSLHFVRGSEIVLGKLDSAKADPLLITESVPELDSALLRLEAEEGRLYRLWLQTGHASVENAILTNYDQQLRLVERSRTIARMTANRASKSSNPKQP